MRRQWRALEQRFAGLKRRERGFVLAGLVVLVLWSGFWLFDASVARQRVLVKDIEQMRADTTIAQGQSAQMARQLAEDPDAQAQARIAQLSKETRDIEMQMLELNSGLVAPEEMAEILKKMLDVDKGVKLMSLKTLPVSRLREGKQADDVVNVYKHSVEILLQGHYLDVLNYLDRLEKLPRQMFWSEARMDMRDYPAVYITVTVFTLSLDEDWLVV